MTALLDRCFISKLILESAILVVSMHKYRSSSSIEYFDRNSSNGSALPRCIWSKNHGMLGAPDHQPNRRHQPKPKTRERRLTIRTVKVNQVGLDDLIYIDRVRCKRYVK